MLHRNYFRSLFVSLLIAIILAAAAFAMADELPQVTITCRPETLIEPAEITLSFTVLNSTDHSCANLYVSTSDGLVSEPLGSLAQGESISFTRRHTVTENELSSENISYILTYDDPEDPEHKINFTVDTPIHKAESLTQCELTRSFSAQTIAEGGTLTILYTVRNTGNTQLEGLRIRDRLGDFTGRIETLPAGETRSLVSRITVTAACTSETELQYETPDGEQTLRLEDAEITLSEAILENSFSVLSTDKDTSTAVGTLFLKNTGTTDFTDLTVTDDFSGDMIAEGLNLCRGDNYTVQNRFNVRNTKNVRWRIIADSSDGTTIDIITDTLTLTRQETTDPSNVSVSTSALTPRLKRAGNAQVRLQITNNGDSDIYDLHVKEIHTGYTLDLLVVSSGGTLSRDLSIPVDESSELQFNVEYSDIDGWQYSADSEPIEINISSDGVAPDDSSSSFIDFSGGSIRIGGSSMFAILLIIGILLLIVLTVILIVLSHRARIRKQVEIELRKQNKGRS